MTWILDNLELIGELTLAHLAIALPPVVLSLIISVPIGWVANRYRWSRGGVLTLCGLFYAVPSLPLFVALPTIIGTDLQSPLNLVVGLTLYGIALMVRTTADGLASVDADIRLSASAVGFSSRGLFWRVELPLAGPVLLAGLRVVAVSTVSLTTVGAVFGSKSLGLLFTDGIQRNIPEEIWTGIVLTILIALVLDGLIVLLGRILMPWSRLTAPASRREKRAAQTVVVA